ncbi:hypothetical protein [Isoptericola sp. AK164]|uniref:hypothetical protein n=1 Tax=Isoptericola sp. AK164 TaxID=3024246 RepID=UPI0024187AAD|nr:hypothetical protein [Isoptericola sp. AK164]
MNSPITAHEADHAQHALYELDRLPTRELLFDVIDRARQLAGLVDVAEPDAAAGLYRMASELVLADTARVHAGAHARARVRTR